MKTKRVIFLLILLLACTGLAGVSLLAYGFLATAVAPSEEQLVLIEPGTPFSQVALELEQAGVVNNARYFVWLSRWQDQSGRIQAGEYQFSAAATPQQVLDRLIRGDVRHYQVTFPEGLNLRETARRAATAGIAGADRFFALATDPKRAERYGIPAETLEGYLFPETYTLQSTTTAEELIAAMVNQSLEQLTPALVAAAAEQGLDRHQLVILASIIQKEAGSTEEMPLISAVFHNRLRRGIALQADPTVIYGIADFDGNLTRRHLQTPTPYNTYRHRGLPAGPIANPGQAALEAAARPAEVDYLYFVARGDGTHQFSTTLAEHNRAVRRYQLRR